MNIVNASSFGNSNYGDWPVDQSTQLSIWLVWLCSTPVFFFFFFNGLWNYQYILPVVEIFHDLSLFSALSWRGDFQFDAEENLQPFGHQIQSCRWNPAGKWERGQFPEHQWMNVQHNSSLLQTSFVSICQAIYFTIIDLVLHEYIRKYFISINMF